MVVQVAATDADDPTYGNSARVIYSIIHGQPYFSVEPRTGRFMLGTGPSILHVSVALFLHICYKHGKFPSYLLKTIPESFTLSLGPWYVYS